MEDAQFSTPEEKEGIQIPTLRDTLIAVTFAPKRTIDPNIRRIALGILKKETDYLRQLTRNDPRHRERARIIYVTRRRTIGIGNDVFVGTEKGVHSSPVIKGKTRTIQGEQIFIPDEYVGTTLHTHPDKTPFSGIDIAGLLVDDEDSAAARSAAFVISPDLNLVGFRSNLTPEMSHEEAKREGKAIDRMIEANPFLTSAALLRFMQDTHHLEFFSGQADHSVLTKMTA